MRKFQSSMSAIRYKVPEHKLQKELIIYVSILYECNKI